MPAPDEIDDKLTPAARQALDELVSDYRNQVLVDAAESASRLGDFREVSVHDILTSLSRRNALLSGTPRSSVDRILRLYVAAGTIVGVSGAAAFLLQDIIHARTSIEQLPALLAIAGFALAALSFFMLTLRGTRTNAQFLQGHFTREFESDDVSTFLSTWRELELSLREAASLAIGESAASAPFSLLVEALAKEHAFSSADHDVLLRLIKLRNAIVHRGARTEERAAISNALRDARRMLDRLRSRRPDSSQ